MNTTPQYHEPLLEALCAFLRDSTIGKPINDKNPPATDIQAVLTVIGRRNPAFELGVIGLAGVTVPRASLREANLSGADLSHANLDHANLSYGNLRSAYLRAANSERRRPAPRRPERR